MSRMTNLDNKVLGRQASPAAQAREAWGRKHGWSLFLLLGVVLLGIGGWAASRPDRPVTAGMSFLAGGVMLAFAAWLFFRRDRS
jgi:hypothetical protein